MYSVQRRTVLGAASGWVGPAWRAKSTMRPLSLMGDCFFATGNGSFAIQAPTTPGQPYSNPTNSYGMSVLDLDLTGGQLNVEDVFLPSMRLPLVMQDADLGSGGPVLLPSQTLASGKILNPLLQVGKSGMFYILDRDNANDGSNKPATEYSPAGLGGFNAAGDQVEQEVQTPQSPDEFIWLGSRRLGHRSLLEQQYLFGWNEPRIEQ